eukprot:gene5113-152_t
MSTRFSRESRKSTENGQAILHDMLEQPDNKICADCGARGPRWASWNLGIFLCIRCSGIHRSLGVHISKVRSVTLDTWAPEWVESMTSWGNKRAADQWEYHLPKDFKRPSQDNSGMEMFIRSKYVNQKYKRTSKDPPLSEAANDNARTVVTEKKTEKKKKSKQRPTDLNSGSKGSVMLDFSRPVKAPPVSAMSIGEQSSTSANATTKSAPLSGKTNTSENLLVDLFGTDSKPTQSSASSSSTPSPFDALTTTATVSASTVLTTSVAQPGTFESTNLTTSVAPIGSTQSGPAKSNFDDIMSLFDQPKQQQSGFLSHPTAYYSGGYGLQCIQQTMVNPDQTNSMQPNPSQVYAQTQQAFHAMALSNQGFQKEPPQSNSPSQGFTIGSPLWQ